MEVPLQIPSMYCAEMIAQLHDANKKVTIPGFYDQGSEHFREERAEMAKHHLI